MSDRPDDIGFCKPPKHRQFVKGKSGNPKGRPKGSKNVATLFYEILFQKIKATDHGVTREITKFQASAMQLVNKAATGDMRALNTLMHWLRLIQSLVDNSETPTPLAGEDDKAVMASILKRIQEIDPQKEGNEE